MVILRFAIYILLYDCIYCKHADSLCIYIVSSCILLISVVDSLKLYMPLNIPMTNTSLIWRPSGGIVLISILLDIIQTPNGNDIVADIIKTFIL